MAIKLSRISKLFTDRSGEDPRVATKRRQKTTVTIVCGQDVRSSYTLQSALLTAAAIANRCFPGAVRFAGDSAVYDGKLLVWPNMGLSVGAALTTVMGVKAECKAREKDGYSLFIGDVAGRDGEMRLTFDGWRALVGPVDKVDRLHERQLCPVVGVLAASLALSEIFMHFANINVQACRQSVGLSLWRPDIAISDPQTQGPLVEYLPSRLWSIGLGHLGQAFLWNTSMLPYPDPAKLELYLDDFDKAEDTNWEVGLLLQPDPPMRHKTRLVAAWLEDRGFSTWLSERRINTEFRIGPDEPKIAFAGFDNNPARRDLAACNFKRIVDCGLGATASNFDSIALTTWPNPKTAAALWPDDEAHEQRVRELAQEHSVYAELEEDLDCGRYLLAGKSVGVPFVGATAGALAVAELLRALQEGPVYDRLKYRLASPLELPTAHAGSFDPASLAYLGGVGCAIWT